MQQTYDEWAEYDMAAEWCAKHKLTGKVGDALPANLGAPCLELINDDLEAFQERVRQYAYALAMSEFADQD